MDNFAEYAVEQDIIENTPVQRAAITKAVIRAEFKTVVAAGNTLGYTTAATLLNHSLQDSPSDISYGSSTTYASQISKSSECKKIVQQFKADVKGQNMTARTITSSTTLNSTTDLHLDYAIRNPTPTYTLQAFHNILKSHQCNIAHLICFFHTSLRKAFFCK